MTAEFAEHAKQINLECDIGDAASRNSIEHYRKAGELLLEVKAGLKHGKWLKWLKANVRVSERQAQNYMALAKYEVTADLQKYWDILSNPAEDDKIAHVSHNSGEPEWYTPPQYLDAARTVLGTIDLDPASCEAAQRNVQAKQFFSPEDDGLSKEWKGNVWLNPPYSTSLVEPFTAKLCEHVQTGDVPEAILLVNNASETKWLQAALALCSAVCLPAARIKFIDDKGEVAGSPLQGQAFLYFGLNHAKFFNTFAAFGICLLRV
jgi:hypothetical protein